MQRIAKFIYFKVLGWSLEGEFPSHLNKFVIPVVPHTSWWDFFLGLIFEEREIFRLALSPEGTRKKVAKWKTGFYYIAKAAKVPIVLVAFDYGNKQIKISEPFSPSDDISADFKIYEAFFKNVKGKVPEFSF